MRDQLFDALFEVMRTERSVYLVTGDMGYNLVERFQVAYPDRFLNVGIAEQNLLGVAAGLCQAGFRPFVYSISNFLVHRGLEQLRNDVVLHRHPIVLLGTGAGFDNGPLGATHLMLDDLGVLRALCEMDLYCPGDLRYGERLPQRLAAVSRPAYVRIPKITFRIDGPEPADLVVRQGRLPRVLLMTYGAMAEPCLQVAARHEELSVVVMNRLYPFDADALRDVMSRHERVVIVEDHFPSSGLYSLICQFCVQHALPLRLESLAPPEHYPLVIGKRDYFHRLHGLDAAGIERAALHGAERLERVAS